MLEPSAMFLHLQLLSFMSASSLLAEHPLPQRDPWQIEASDKTFGKIS